MSDPTRFRRPSRSLHGRVAIVTGAGSLGEGIGNGRATAILLAEDGCRVVCVDRDLALARRTVEMIEQEHKDQHPHHTQDRETSEATTTSRTPLAIAIEADITSPTACESIVNQTVATYGRIDILFNCVGVGGPSGTAVEVDIAAWAKGLETNVTSMVLMSKYAIPVMTRNTISPDHGKGHDASTADPAESRSASVVHSPCRGSIVNMGSVAGIQGGTPHLLYPTSKGAVVNMTRAMAAHHAKDGIRVNCVCPGMVYTPMMYGEYAAGGESGASRRIAADDTSQASTTNTPEDNHRPMVTREERREEEGSASRMTASAREARKNRSLLRTEGTAWDVACAVRFLASDQARWITGLVMPVDAGVTAAVGTDVPKEASVASR